LVELYEKGLINVSYDESLEAIIEITPEGMDIIKASGLIDINEEFNI
jgi:predicted transcriptional regulator